MPKRKVQGEAPPKDSRGIKKRKPVTPKITVSSDPSIPSDYNRIEKLLEQKKSWREIANYFGNHTAESIKKRFHLCKKVLMETFSPEEDEKLKAFLLNYETQKYAAAGKALGKSATGVKRRLSELELA